MRVTAIALHHIDPSRAKNISSAPRDFEILAYEDDYTLEKQRLAEEDLSGHLMETVGEHKAPLLLL